MIVSRSRTINPLSSSLTSGGIVLKEPDDLLILRVTFDSKMTFEKHLHSVSRAASQRLGISRKCCRLFHDRSLLGRCFRDFVLPALEYCSAEWPSAADTHLRLLDLGAHRYTYATPRCRTSQYRRIFIPHSVFLWNNLADPVCDGVALVDLFFYI